MRRFPSSWDKTLSALGFRRNTKRIKRDHYHRQNRRIEKLEVRAMLANDPLAYWEFDDGSGLSATDSSVNAYHATLDGGTWYSTDGVNDGYLLLDRGLEDYVDISAAGNQITGTSDFTISGWIKADGVQGQQQTIFGVNDQNGGNKFLLFLGRASNNSINDQLVLHDNVTWRESHTSTSVGDGEWHHFSVTRKSNLISLYTDGVLQSSYTSTVAFNNTDKWSIGQEFDEAPYSESDHLNGSVDEFRLYSRALSALEIAELAGVGTLESNHWSFDTNGNDQLGNGLHATLSGNAYVESSSEFLGGGALRLDGVGDYASLNQEQFKGEFTQYSASAWFKTDKIDGTQIIFEEGGFAHGISLRLEGTKLVGGVKDNYALRKTDTIDNVTAGEWHFAAITYNDGDLQIFLDDQASEVESTGFGMIPYHSDQATIGAGMGNSIFSQSDKSYFSGLIDSVRVFDGVALTQAELAFLSGGNIVVTTLADQSSGSVADGVSLREALAFAKLRAGTDTITFDPALFLDGQQTLLLGDLNGNGIIESYFNENPYQIQIDSEVEIVGPGADLLSINGGAVSGTLFGEDTVFFVDATAVATISGISITGGRLAGIFSLGDLTLDQVEVSDNVGYGILSAQTVNDLTITRSTIAGNELGGIQTYYGGFDIANTTISGNEGVGGVEFLSNSSNTGVLTNVTITDNQGDSVFSGGVNAQGPGSLTINNSILIDNTNNQGISDIAPDAGIIGLETIFSGTNNLIGESNDSGLSDGDTVSDADLLSLDYYGKPTRTHALGENSLAIDEGDNAVAIAANLTTDQRGFQRIADGGVNGATVDIGAYELTSTILVDTTLDVVDGSDGVTSLREAIKLANLSPGDETIKFDVDVFSGQQTITLTADHDGDSRPDQLTIEDLSGNGDSIYIVGPGADRLTIDGGGSNIAETGADFVFFIDTSGAALLSGLTITKAEITGIANAGQLTVEEIEASGNHKYGIFSVESASNTTINRSTIAENGNYGLYFRDASFNIANSTISSNGYLGDSYTAAGIYIHNEYTSSSITNSTITDNNVHGIINTFNILPTFTNNIIINNSFSGIHTDIIDFGSSTPVLSNNLIGHAIAIEDFQDGALVQDVNLLPLGDYGGPTRTHALGENSIAIDAGDNAVSIAANLTTDQRGFQRIADGDSDPNVIVDIGSFERLSYPETYLFQTLEGVLRVDNRIGLNDEVVVSVIRQNDIDYVKVNDFLTDIDSSKITGIEIFASDQGDRIDVNAVELVRFPSLLEESVVVHGGAGNDEIFGANVKSILSGGAGDDHIYGGSDDDLIYGDDGSDVIFGGAGHDIIDGGLNNDSLFGEEGNDQIYGQGGDDTIHGEGGDDDLLGGEGRDKLFGSDGEDTLQGGAGDDLLRGGADDDFIVGGVGNDSIDGGSGSFDRLNGGLGSDQYFLTELSASRNLVIDLQEDEDANAIDVFNLTNASVGGFIDLNLNTDEFSQFIVYEVFPGIEIDYFDDTQIENAIGSSQADTLIGKHNSLLSGGDGDDHLQPGSGSSTLEGGQGNDVYHINDTSGRSTIVDDSGTDTLDFSNWSVANGVVVDLAQDGLQNQPSAINVSLTFPVSTIENVIGSNSNDIILGDINDNEIRGGDGYDIIEGRGGNDILLGEGDFDAIEIRDNSSAFESGPAWRDSSDQSGFNHGQRILDISHPEANSDHFFVWEFVSLEAGDYEVFVTWQTEEDPTLGATNAKFNVAGTDYYINQQVNPQGIVLDEVPWQKLGGDFTVLAGDTLTVLLNSINLEADGNLYADAVRLVKINHAPVIADPLPSDLVVGESENLDITLSATDDGSISDLIFSIAGDHPAGLIIVPDGPGSARILWPSFGRPEGEFNIPILVTDQGESAKTTLKTITLSLGDANSAPSSITVSGVTGGTKSGFAFDMFEGDTLAFSANSTDGSANLFFSLSPDAPAGASIDSSGQFSWSPEEHQNSVVVGLHSTPHTFDIRVTDDGNPPLRVSQTISIVVNSIDDFPEFIVGSLKLKNDTGASGNNITSDPRIEGLVWNDNGLDKVRVEVDYDYDGYNFSTDEIVALESFEGTEGVASFVSSMPLEFLREIQLDSTVTVAAYISQWDQALGQYVSDPLGPQLITFDYAVENILPVLNDFELKNDTGDIVNQSTDPTLKGRVTNDGEVGGLAVYFYDDLNSTGDPMDLMDIGVPIGSVTTDAEGYFEFKPTGITEGLVNIWAVVEEILPTGIGPSPDFITIFDMPVRTTADTNLIQFSFVAGVAPTITSLGLRNDTGLPSDGITSETTIVGQISNPDGELSGVVIEFDHDGIPDTIEGMAITEEDGTFIYEPLGLDTLPVTINARAIYEDLYQQTILEGTWLDLTTTAVPLDITWNDSANEIAIVTSLELAFDNPSGAVSDPTLRGTVTNDGDLEGIVVEFSYDVPVSGQLTAIVGIAITDELGNFEFKPHGLPANEITTVYAQAIEYINDTKTANPLGIQSQVVTLSDTPLPADAEFGLSLAFDTGSSSSDEITSDPTVQGTINYNGNYSDLIVEFDYDNNGSVDGTGTPDSNGYFVHTPEGLLDGQSYSIQARIRVPDYSVRDIEYENQLLSSDWYDAGYDYDNNVWDTEVLDSWYDTIFSSDGTSFDGDWYNSDFQRDWESLFSDYATEWSQVDYFLATAENTPALLQQPLVLSTIASPQLDPTVEGVVVNDGNVEDLTVEFYLNGNSTPDGTALTDSSGFFTYTLNEHDTGSNSVVVRVLENDNYATEIIQTHSSIHSLTIDSNLKIGIDNLVLKYGWDDSGLKSIDPTLIGTVSGTQSLVSQTIQFDYNNDGVIDATTETNGLGDFEFTPTGLTVGAGNLTSVKVRALEDQLDSNGESNFSTYSDWTTLSWQVVDNQAPTIQTFELKHDTGHLGLGHQRLDRVTTDPTLQGRLSDDNRVDFVTVQFDHDGDFSTIEGTSTTDINGYFTYTPLLLSVGTWDIRARVLEHDPVADTLLDSGWAAITSDDNPTSTSIFNGFTLVAPTAADVTSLSLANQAQHDLGNHFDPTLIGTVSDLDSHENVTVNFYLNSSGDSIGSTTVNSDGTFTYTPVGLEFNTIHNITAKAFELDYSTGDLVEGGQQQVLSNIQLVKYTDNNFKVYSFEEDDGPSKLNLYFKGRVGVPVSLNTNDVEVLYVEIDLLGDGTVDETVSVQTVYPDASSDAEYHFNFSPKLLSPVTNAIIRARPVGVDVNGMVFGDWVQTGTLNYDPELAIIEPSWTIEGDTTPATRATLTPIIYGQAVIPTNFGGFNTEVVSIEFDLNQDGLADESILTDSNGNFTYEFENFDAGDISVPIRVVRLNTFTVDEVETGEEIEVVERIEGVWQDIDFTLLSDKPVIKAGSLSLVQDTGDEMDGQTTNPTIKGRAESPLAVTTEGLVVEVDHDQDGFADGTTIVLASGDFEYTPENLTPDQEVYLNLRIVDNNSSSTPIYGEWFKFNFALLAIETPTVTSLNLEIDEGLIGDPRTSSPALIGVATRHEKTTLQVIEFDHNGDGVIDGSVTTNTSGEYRYIPEGLVYGSNLIRARAVSQLESDTLVGDWSEIYSFFYVSAVAPVTNNYELLDSKTGRVSGRTTVNGNGQELLIEISVTDSQGERSQFTSTNTFGYFEYQPEALASGSVTLKVRALLLDQSSGSTIYEEDWKAVNFTHNPDPFLDSNLTLFDLLNDTQSPSDNITSDPTLNGNVSNYAPGLSIQFAHDDTSAIDGQVGVNPDGSFEYLPLGLTDGQTTTIYARTYKWNPVSNTYVEGNWNELPAVGFTLDSIANAIYSVNLRLSYNLVGEGITPRSTQPIFSGTVTGAGNLSGLLLEFDHQGDGDIDGTAITGQDGSFIYEATDLTPGSNLQKISARVVETDYFDQRIENAFSSIYDFVYESAPVVDTISYLNGEDHLTVSVVSDTPTQNLELQYLIHGNSDFSVPIPIELGGYEPSDPIMSQPIDNTGESIILLSDLGIGAAGVIVRAVDNSTGQAIIGPWESYSFVKQSSNLIPLEINGFGLLEDTHTGAGTNADGITSNTTVVGTLGTNSEGAFSLVEIRVIDFTEGTLVSTARVNTDANGSFEYTPVLELGVKVTIEAASVLYDPTLDPAFDPSLPSDSNPELLGTPVSKDVTRATDNGIPTILGFGLIESTTPITNPTLQGDVINDGRISGLQVEFDLDNDGVADDFAFTDETGHFEYTPYNLTVGNHTIRARVIEWDGNLQEYVPGDFASSVVTFMLTEAGPVQENSDLWLEENGSAIANADLGIEDGVYSYLNQIEGNGSSSGVIDVGIGSVQLRHRAGATESDDVGDTSNQTFTAVPFDQVSGSATPTSGPISEFATNKSGEIEDGQYYYSKDVTIDSSSKTVSIDIFYIIIIGDYERTVTGSDLDTDQSNSNSLKGSGTYTFEYHAIVTYDSSGTGIISGWHTLDEDFNYDYLQRESGSNPSGGYTYTVSGDQDYDYHEDAVYGSNGELDQTFGYTESNRLESWYESQRSSNYIGSNGSSSNYYTTTTYTLYSETITNDGVINLNSSGEHSVIGVYTTDTLSNTSHADTELATYTNNYGTSTEQGTRSSSTSSENTRDYKSVENYTLGESRDVISSLKEISSYLFAESGAGSLSTAGGNSESWNYIVTGSWNIIATTDATTTANLQGDGSIARTSSDVSTWHGDYSVMGTSNGNLTFSNSTDSGTASSTYNFTSGGTFDVSTISSSNNIESDSANSGTIFGTTGYASSNTWTTSRLTGSVTGHRSTDNSNANYSSRSSSGYSTTGNTITTFSSSNIGSNASGTFSNTYNSDSMLANQSAGTSTSDGVVTNFRNNSAESDSLKSTDDGFFSYVIGLNAVGALIPFTSSSTGRSTANRNSSSRSSSFAGNNSGSSTSKSTSRIASKQSSNYNELNGLSNQSGTYTESTYNSNDSTSKANDTDNSDGKTSSYQGESGSVTTSDFSGNFTQGPSGRTERGNNSSTNKQYSSDRSTVETSDSGPDSGSSSTSTSKSKSRSEGNSKSNGSYNSDGTSTSSGTSSDNSSSYNQSDQTNRSYSSSSTPDTTSRSNSTSEVSSSRRNDSNSTGSFNAGPDGSQSSSTTNSKIVNTGSSKDSSQSTTKIQILTENKTTKNSSRSSNSSKVTTSGTGTNDNGNESYNYTKTNNSRGSSRTSEKETLTDAGYFEQSEEVTTSKGNNTYSSNGNLNKSKDKSESRNENYNLSGSNTSKETIDKRKNNENGTASSASYSYSTERSSGNNTSTTNTNDSGTTKTTKDGTQTTSNPNHTTSNDSSSSSKNYNYKRDKDAGTGQKDYNLTIKTTNANSSGNSKVSGSEARSKGKLTEDSVKSTNDSNSYSHKSTTTYKISEDVPGFDEYFYFYYRRDASTQTGRSNSSGSPNKAVKESYSDGSSTSTTRNEWDTRSSLSSKKTTSEDFINHQTWPVVIDILLFTLDTVVTVDENSSGDGTHNETITTSSSADGTGNSSLTNDKKSNSSLFKVTTTTEKSGHQYPRDNKYVDTIDNTYESTYSYDSRHDIIEGGLAVGGRLYVTSDSTDRKVVTSDSKKDFLDYEEGVDGFDSIENNFNQKTTTTTTDNSENGSYHDERIGSGSKRVSEGYFKGKTKVDYDEKENGFSKYVYSADRKDVNSNKLYTTRAKEVTTNGSYGPDESLMTTKKVEDKTVNGDYNRVKDGENNNGLIHKVSKKFWTETRHSDTDSATGATNRSGNADETIYEKRTGAYGPSGTLVRFYFSIVDTPELRLGGTGQPKSHTESRTEPDIYAPKPPKPPANTGAPVQPEGIDKAILGGQLFVLAFGSNLLGGLYFFDEILPTDEEYRAFAELSGFSQEFASATNLVANISADIVGSLIGTKFLKPLANIPLTQLAKGLGPTLSAGVNHTVSGIYLGKDAVGVKNAALDSYNAFSNRDVNVYDKLNSAWEVLFAGHDLYGSGRDTNPRYAGPNFLPDPIGPGHCFVADTLVIVAEDTPAGASSGILDFTSQETTSSFNDETSNASTDWILAFAGATLAGGAMLHYLSQRRGTSKEEALAIWNRLQSRDQADDDSSLYPCRRLENKPNHETYDAAFRELTSKEPGRFTENDELELVGATSSSWSREQEEERVWAEGEF